jgi:hypothetical protein
MPKSHMKDSERLLRLRMYEAYRDLPKPRTYDRLIVVIEPTIGVVSKRRVTVIAREDRWKERVGEFDSATAKPALIVLDPKFDRTDRLLKAAHLALERAIVDQTRKPAEMKALVDTAEKAIRLVEKLRELGVDPRGPKAAGEAQVNVRKILAYLKRQKMEALAAAGTPVTTHEVIDVEVEEIPHGEPVVAEDRLLPSPSEKPLQTASMDREHLLAEADKVLTVAERLKLMARKP